MAKKKTTRKKVAAKKKAPARKKASSKAGKRYSAQEKAQVVQFVRAHNQAKGRGGQSAAVKKFGVSALTVSKWLKDAGAKKPRKKAVVRTKVPVPVVPGHTRKNTVVDALERMLAIQRQIGELQCEYEGLKGRL